MKSTSQQTKLITILKNIKVMKLTFVFMSIIKTMNDTNNIIIDAMDWISFIQLDTSNNKQNSWQNIDITFFNT